MNAAKINWPGWKTVRIIGRGSFGTVYEIRREVFGHTETAALKVISIPESAEELEELRNEGYDAASISSHYKGYLEEIVREYSLMLDLKGNSNVVYCDDLQYMQHSDGIGWDICIKMELLTSLKASLGQVYDEKQVIRLGTDLCQALTHCHGQHIIHRDIKPENIFVSKTGDYKLGDFGVAKITDKTATGTKIGTYDYMSPEVYHGQHYGHGADLYSLGLVLYWMMNNRRTPLLPAAPQIPSAGEKESARNRRFSGENLPPPVNGSEALKRVVLKACAYDPKERYQSAQEMMNALMRLGRGAIPAPVVDASDDAWWDDEETVGPFSRGASVRCTDEDSGGTVGPYETGRGYGSFGDFDAGDDETIGPGFGSRNAPGRKRKWHKPAAVAAVLLLVLGVGIVAGVLAWRSWAKPPDLPGVPGDTALQQTGQKPSQPTSQQPSQQPTDDELYPDDGFGGDVPEVSGDRKEGVYTFLLVGTDKDDGNTDTIMVVCYDTVNQKINIMSIPRDTMINEWWDIKKINSIYSRYADGIGALKKAVKTLIGFTPDFYVKVELEMFVELVDLIGGVEFDVPQDMDYEDPYQDLYIHLKEGRQVLDGEKAMQLVRFRRYDLGDIGRVQVQQDFLKALIKECISLQHWGKIKAYIDLGLENVQTDLDFGSVVWFAANVLGLNEAPALNMDNVNTYMLPGNYIDGTWCRTFPNSDKQSYVTVYANKTIALVNESFNPYKKDVTIGNLDIMSILENGDIASSTGNLKDTEHNQWMAVRRGEAHYDEDGDVIYTEENGVPLASSSEPDEATGPLALNQSNITIASGTTARLTTTGGTGKVKWSTSNEHIATVKDGSITGVAGGTVTITATAGEETVSCTITVTGTPWVSDAKLSLNRTDVTFAVGDPPFQLKVNGTDSPVVWSSKNPDVVVISESGVLSHGSQKGTTKVIASVDGQVLECIVRVP